MHCGDCQELHTSHSQHTEQGESCLDDTKSRNKVSPDKGIRPDFLSSMDDGEFDYCSLTFALLRFIKKGSVEEDQTLCKTIHSCE